MLSLISASAAHFSMLQLVVIKKENLTGNLTNFKTIKVIFKRLLQVYNYFLLNCKGPITPESYLQKATDAC